VPGGLSRLQSGAIINLVHAPPSQAEQLTTWTLACYLRYDTDTACTHENVHSSNMGLTTIGYRKKLMWLADILPGGGGWRKKSA